VDDEIDNEHKSERENMKILTRLFLVSCLGIAVLLGSCSLDRFGSNVAEAAWVPVLKIHRNVPATVTATAAPLATADFSDFFALDTTIIGRVKHQYDGNAIGGFRHQWPAVYATAAFDGDAVTLAFNDQINRYRVFVDDTRTPTLTITRPGTTAVALTGLVPGPHIIRLEKISESASDEGEVVGLFVQTIGAIRPPPEQKTRQIEFIGDSDTVGYGNMSTTRDCAAEDVFELTDTQQSFGPRIAGHFDADYQMIAQSGIGLVRNYDGFNPDMTMIARYPETLNDNPTSQNWRPQMVVLTMGSNDFATELKPAESWDDLPSLRTDFESQYLHFLTDLRDRYPEAGFVLVAIENYGQVYLETHQAVLAGIHARGDKMVSLAVVPEITQRGCHWHPSRVDHKAIADVIIDAIGDRTNPWLD
jgi:lysophospholipase L1-like esterase